MDLSVPVVKDEVRQETIMVEQFGGAASSVQGKRKTA
jgi:hypothetical protein